MKITIYIYYIKYQNINIYPADASFARLFAKPFAKPVAKPVALQSLSKKAKDIATSRCAMSRGTATSRATTAGRLSYFVFRISYLVIKR